MSRRSEPGRRDALMEAGRTAFATHGVEGTTIDRIAQIAGVGKGTFYLYFHSKGDLIKALRAQFAEQLAEHVKTVERDGTVAEWIDAAQHLISAAVDGYLTLAPHYESVLHGSNSDHTDISWADTIIGSLAAFLDQGAQMHAITTNDPDTLALVLFCALDGACHRSLIAGTPSRQRLVDIFDQLLASLTTLKQ